MIKRQDLVDTLKFSFSIGSTTDPTINSITDEDLEKIIIAKSKHLGHVYPSIPKQDEQLVLCLVRKEIYWKMATISAPLYKLNLDGLAVSKEVRFDHYFKLIQEVDKEYNNILKDPTRIQVQQSDLLVRRHYNINKYYNNYVLPTPFIYVDKVNESSIDISIDFNDLQVNDFVKANVYYCDTHIIDKYDNNAINKGASVVEITTHRQPYCRLKFEPPKEKQFILLELILKNGFKCYSDELEVNINVQRS